MKAIQSITRRVTNNDTIEGILSSFAKAQKRLEELARAESVKAVDLACKADELNEASAEAAALSITATAKAAKIAEFLG